MTVQLQARYAAHQPCETKLLGDVGVREQAACL